jgi:predicted deacylase
VTIPAGYRGADDVAASVRGLAGRGVTVEEVGRSVRGEPLLAVTIGRDGPASAILAGIHPIEWIGVEVGLALLDRLIASPPRGRRVIALPLINVDGYRVVDGDLRAGRRRWQRANLGSGGGVDLNRNFPVSFRKGGRRLPTGWNWGGPAPMSEPETRAVVESLRGRGVDRAVSLHSIGNKILMPWGSRWERPDNWDALLAAGRAVAARLPEPYDVIQSSHWVPGAFGHGMELDWLHRELGALALLVECTKGGASWRQPSSLVDPFRWFNPPDPQRRAAELAGALEPFVRSDPLGRQ